MPKTKSAEKTIEKMAGKKAESVPEIKNLKQPLNDLEKIVEIPAEDALELIPGEVSEEDPEDEEAVLDEEEIDPFKDKWEE